MQIILNVDGNQLSDEVKDLLNNLNVEQKQAIAKDMLCKALQDIDGEFDKKLRKTRAIDSIRILKKIPESITDDDVERNYKWDLQSQIEKEQTTKARIVNLVVKETIEAAKDQVQKEIEKNENIQMIVSETLEIIKKDFPKYVQNAMTLYLAEQMSNTMNEVRKNVFDQSLLNQSLHDLNIKLTNKGF